MNEPKRKKKNELWTVERGDCPSDHYVVATFEKRGDAVKARDKINADPRLSSDMRAYLGTIPHNPTS